MSAPVLFRLAGFSAIFAGVLRIVASFIPYKADSLALELLYLAIDLALVFAIVGLFAWEFPAGGVSAFVGFVVALGGTASIVGPDGSLGGVSLYPVGALLIALGLALWAWGSWNARRLPRAVPVLWAASTALGIAAFAIPGASLAFMLAGLAFGAAFVVAGLRLWSEPHARGAS